MAVQYSVAVRNGMLDSIESVTGASPRLIIYTGSPPANCAAAASGSVLATLILPADFYSAATGGTKSLFGSWTASATGAGTAGHYRIWDSTITNCHEQGTITITGSGGDITLDNPVIAVSQVVTINSKTITAGNA